MGVVIDQSSISAVAAVISAAAAFFSWRAATAANKISRRTGMPVLRGEYRTRDNKLMITNYGSGPALNLQLQKNTIHYTDMKVMYEYVIRGSTYPSIMPGETRQIQLSIKDSKNKNTDDSTIWLMANASRRGKLVFIYYDLFNNAYTVSFRCYSLGGGYTLDFSSVHKYTLLSRAWDWLSTCFFRLGVMKSLRERMASK